MPTGYTAAVADGEVTEFGDFAMECARAFGALIELRDSPSSPVPDDFKPSPYHAEQLASTIRRLEVVKGWSPEEAETEAEAAHAKAVLHRDDWRRGQAEKRARYEAMVEQVEAWEPPTSEHVGLKKFMLEQLHQSIEFDCGGSWEPEAERLSGQEFKRHEVERLQKDRVYHEEHYAEDIDRARQRTEWVRALRGSLPSPETVS